MSKRDSILIKGIAILCMFFHHLFYRETRYAEYGFTGLILNEDITLAIAKDLKVCVAVFAFIAGYGMIIKLKSAKNFENITTIRWFVLNAVKTYLGLIKDTCFLIAIIVPVSVIFNLPKSPVAVWGSDGGTVEIIKGVLANMTGMAGFFRIPWFIKSWWYLKVAILFILLFPLLYMVLKRCGGVFLFLTVIITPLLLGVNLSKDNVWRYLPAFIYGMIIADRNFIETLSGWIHEKSKRRIVVGCLLVAIYVATVYIKHTIGFYYVTQSVQAVIIVLLAVLYISKLKKISVALALLGDNSKYMWLIHTYIYGQILSHWLFSMRNIWVIMFCLLAISLVASVILKEISNIFYKRLDKSLHKW